MYYFAVEFTGLPAFIIIMILAYVVVYLPIKFVMIVIAHAKQKADKVQLLRQKTVIAEYDPPHNLTPAELGFLYDSKLNLCEVFATIMSLEQQGIVSLTENDDRWLIAEVDIARQPLKEFEVYILGFLGQHQGKIITKRLLKKAKWKTDLIIKRQLQQAGYLVTTREQVKRSLARLAIILATLVTLTFLVVRPNSIGAVVLLVSVLVFFLWPGYLLVAYFLYRTLQKIAGEPWLGTPKLKQVWSDIEGYRHFIELVELDELQFDSENMKQSVKNKSLPYAIALGFNTGWQRKI